MAKFIKHIGKVGDRKVAIVFREIPGEPHMCLVVYTELLNQNIHDSLMMAIESEAAQQSDSLGEELNRTFTRDGRLILQVLHQEGVLKKIATDQVVVTPVPNQTIRLNELNTLLNEMANGKEAIRKLEEMDRSVGLQDPADVRRRKEMASSNLRAPANGVLDDRAIAASQLEQAKKMAMEAKGLMAESERMMAAAYEMDPSLKPVEVKTEKTSKKSATAKDAPKKVTSRSRKTVPSGA